MSSGASLQRSESGKRGSGRAFTLIEVLVVVAIIALLVAILLPSLAIARESTRSALCLSDLKQLGNAVQMYTTDNKSVLPGPLHPMLMRDTYDAFYRDRDADSSNSGGGFYRRQQLVFYISKYLSDKSKTAQSFDRLATCPTGEALASSNIKQMTSSGVFTGYKGYRPFNYIVNSVKVTGAGDTGDNSYGPPYHGTKPPFYFGVIYAGYTFEQWAVPASPDGRTQFDLDQGLKAGQRIPKKIEVVKQAGKEWAIADAWYAEVNAISRTGSGSQLKPGGTWPYLQLSGQSSLSPGGLMMIPTWAYHNTRRSYVMTYESAHADNDPRSLRFREGRTNAAYLDGHAEGARGWQGAANPCMPGDSSCN